MHRHDNRLYFKRLEPEALRYPYRLAGGLTVEDACLQRSDSGGRPGGGLGAENPGWFQNWAALGWFCSLKMNSLYQSVRRLYEVRWQLAQITCKRP